MANLLWNARLLFVERATPDPHALGQWYARVFDDTFSACGAQLWQLRNDDRWMLFSQGATKRVPRIGFAFPSRAQWAAYRDFLRVQGVADCEIAPQVSGVIAGDAFAIKDLDGRELIFCVSEPSLATRAARLPGRLQHFVCASTQTPAMLDFYRDKLGFLESDRVVDDAQALSAAFVRSDAEHHSFAVFRAPASGPDHHAYEAPDWNAIRDWADHLGTLEIPLWWGPGRHGVGNNLFFMIEDPEGYKLEISAELEHMTAEQAFRTWPHGQRALNLWGNAWMRS